MKISTDRSLRDRLVIAAVCGMTICVLLPLVKSRARQVGGQGDSLVFSNAPSHGARVELVPPEGVEVRSALAPPTHRREEPGLLGAADDVARKQKFGQDAWELIAQLEVLARTPPTFHASAAPLIERLTMACTPDAVGGGTEIDAEARTLAQDLLDTVVQNPAGTTLVRGAAFLALAPLLSQSEFFGTFDTWFSGDRNVPLELLRTAALAATRIGSLSPGNCPLRLAKLAALPNRNDSMLPRFYPLVLDRIAPARACDSIRLWLDSGDPRRELFQLSSTELAAGVELEAAGDYFVTAEILFCVWGHQCLRNTFVEREVLRVAQMQAADQPAGSLVCVRAANFLVFALAMCSDAFLDAAVTMGSSANPISASMARNMESLAGDGLGIALMARIERLRYSPEPQDKVDLILILTKVGETLGQDPEADEAERKLATDYLGGLVEDLGVAENARAAALTAIVRAGTWPATKAAAITVLSRNGPALLTAITLNGLLDQARLNPAHRNDVLALLRQFSDQGALARFAMTVDEYAAELDR